MGSRSKYRLGVNQGDQGRHSTPLGPRRAFVDLCRLASNSGYRCIGVWCALQCIRWPWHPHLGGDFPMRPRVDGWRRALQHLPSRVLGPLFSKSAAPSRKSRLRSRVDRGAAHLARCSTNHHRILVIGRLPVSCEIMPRFGERRLANGR